MDMRNNKRIDYEAISRRSIKRDFYPEKIYIRQKKVQQNENSAKITTFTGGEQGEVYRVISINPACEYAKFARYIVGKLVRLINKTGMGNSTTGWYEFVADDDRVCLNDAAGWSNNKRMYLFERPKLR